MNSYGEKVLNDFITEGMGKAKDSMVASVQYYSNKIINEMNNIPHTDTVFFLAAIKMLNRTLGTVFAEESRLAEGLVSNLGVDAVLVSTNHDGSDKQIIHIKDNPKE